MHIAAAASIDAGAILTGFELDTGAGGVADLASSLVDGAAISFEAADWLY